MSSWKLCSVSVMLHMKKMNKSPLGAILHAGMLSCTMHGLSLGLQTAIQGGQPAGVLDR